MRCPKCGYISFDYLDTCLKCKKNIKKTSSTLRGSVYSAAAPSFLIFNSESDREEVTDLETFEDETGEIEFQDPALAVLLQDDSEEDVEVFASIEDEDTELPSDFFDNIEDDVDEQDLDEEETEEFSVPVAEMTDESELMDSALLKDSFTSADTLETAAPDENDDSPMLHLDFPDELNDISDLAPDVEEPREDFVEQSPAGLSDDDSFDLDTDFNLDLGSLDLHDMPEPAALSFGDANLDSVDDDLDFELDLEGLSFDDK